MEMIFNSGDVEKLIKEKYNGAEITDIPKELVIKVSIDLDKLLAQPKQQAPRQQVSVPASTPVAQKLTPDQERVKGLMSSGGRTRTLQHIA